MPYQLSWSASPGIASGPYGFAASMRRTPVVLFGAHAHTAGDKSRSYSRSRATPAKSVRKAAKQAGQGTRRQQPLSSRRAQTVTGARVPDSDPDRYFARSSPVWRASCGASLASHHRSAGLRVVGPRRIHRMPSTWVWPSMPRPVREPSKPAPRRAQTSAAAAQPADDRSDSWWGFRCPWPCGRGAEHNPDRRRYNPWFGYEILRTASLPHVPHCEDGRWWGTPATQPVSRPLVGARTIPWGTCALVTKLATLSYIGTIGP